MKTLWSFGAQLPGLRAGFSFLLSCWHLLSGDLTAVPEPCMMEQRGAFNGPTI